jgi:glycosyltransferase involved in cell wall biosynthesis
VLFVGDPHAPGRETRCDGRLVLHRWCQWISAYHPGGVYEGEEGKLQDFNASAPPFVVDEIALPAIAGGRLVVILGEEWHTAEAMCRVSDLLHAAGQRSRAVLLWNANNTIGFHRIDWPRLRFTTAITTVSRYMKHEMWSYGVNPMVIPNGIPQRLLSPVDETAVGELRRSLARPTVLTKVARWDPDKRWMMAVEAVARLKARGGAPVLVARGGMEAHESEVLDHARGLGLRVHDVAVEEHSVAGYARAFHEAGAADVVNVKSFVPLDYLRLLYAGSDAVLANSGREPFGLVALEAMASGGVVFTGATGEDYVVHMENAIALETEDPEEAAWYVRFLGDHAAAAARIAAAARQTAERFVWAHALGILVSRAEYVAARQGALEAHAAGGRLDLGGPADRPEAALALTDSEAEPARELVSARGA